MNGKQLIVARRIAEAGNHPSAPEWRRKLEQAHTSKELLALLQEISDATKKQ